MIKSYFVLKKMYSVNSIETIFHIILVLVIDSVTCYLKLFGKVKIILYASLLTIKSHFILVKVSTVNNILKILYYPDDTTFCLLQIFERSILV